MDKPHHSHLHHAADSAPKTGGRDTIYTCPMHPQIRQEGPGHCPICGMALEPLLPGEAVDDSELRAVKRRFWIAAALSLPVVLIAMAPHVLDFHVAPATARCLRYAELL